MVMKGKGDFGGLGFLGTQAACVSEWKRDRVGFAI